MSNLDRVFEAMKQAGMMDSSDPQQAQYSAIANSLQSQDMPITAEVLRQVPDYFDEPIIRGEWTQDELRMTPGELEVIKKLQEEQSQ